MTGPGEGGRGDGEGDARCAVGGGVLDTHIAWRSLVLSGLTAVAVVCCAGASEVLFDVGHAATAGVFYVVCFACVYPFSRFFQARTARSPLPAYFGETRLALLLVAYRLLAWRDPSLARPGYLAPCPSLMLGGCADAFRLSAAAVRRGVGLRQAVVLAARFEHRRPGGVNR